MARNNAELNGLSGQIDFITADVFEYLTSLSDRNSKQFDFIILDPPAFTKSRKTAANAEKGYKEINTRALMDFPGGSVVKNPPANAGDGLDA